MATKTAKSKAKAAKAPSFRLTIGRVSGGKYTFTKQQLESLTEVLTKAKAALGNGANVRELIISVR